MHMVYWKFRIKAQKFTILTIICLLFMNLSIVLHSKLFTPQSVAQFGSIKVGEPLPSFIGVSQSGIEVGPTYPKGGKFYIHVVDEQLPACCLDLECGKQAETVVNRGGHLIGGSDGKYAKIFSVKMVKDLTLTTRVLHSIKPFAEKLGWKIQVHWWRLETSLVVVADGEGRIIRIYKNAGIKHVPHIVRDLDVRE